jgi:lactoylglutathione lyase
MAGLAHVALWTRDLDAAAAFWAEHFGVEVGAAYESRNRPGFRSRFLTLADGARIELMAGPWVGPAPEGEPEGWAHVALSVGSEAEVRRLAERFAGLGFLKSGPRITGDGYFEAVIRAPGGLLVEITV